jgi:hypothetical protein
MTITAVCDAWMADLIANTALSAVPAKCRHLYASWSPEHLQAFTNERHVAVFPNREVDTPARVTTAPSDVITTVSTILVWEESASEATGLYDDDTANLAWFALYEAVLARLYVGASAAGSGALGGAGLRHHFQQSRMDMVGAVRFFEIVFTTERDQSFT